MRDDPDNAETVGQRRLRRAGVNANGVGIENLDHSDVASVELISSVRVRHRRWSLQGERHVLGGEIRAVAKLDTLPEVKLPSPIIDRAPRERQARQHALILVLKDQGVEEML